MIDLTKYVAYFMVISHHETPPELLEVMFEDEYHRVEQELMDSLSEDNLDTDKFDLILQQIEPILFFDRYRLKAVPKHLKAFL